MYVFFTSRRRHTRYWRDWSSDVCSSDLGLPFALATFVLGISFGVLARSLGWGVVAPIVFSVITFSGSAQFAVAAVLGASGGGLAGVPPGRLPYAPVFSVGGGGGPLPPRGGFSLGVGGGGGVGGGAAAG